MEYLLIAAIGYIVIGLFLREYCVKKDTVKYSSNIEARLKNPAHIFVIFWPICLTLLVVLYNARKK